MSHSYEAGSSSAVNGKRIITSSVSEINEEDITFIDKIEEGTTSRVFFGFYNEEYVTIKELRTELKHFQLESEKQQIKIDFENELLINMQLNHPNIIRLIGYVKDSDKNLKSLVFEHYESNKLNCKVYGESKYNHNHIEKVLNISIFIANTLSYIHSIDVVHGEINPSRFRISNDFIPKLGNWGHSSLLFDNVDNRTRKHAYTGSLEFMAPEVLNNANYTTAIDVYSFGILLYCLISGNSNPYFDRASTTAEVEQEIIFENLRPNLQFRYIPESLKQIMKMCWDPVPSFRPTMDVVETMLCTSLRQIERQEREKENSKSSFFDWIWANNKVEQDKLFDRREALLDHDVEGEHLNLVDDKEITS